MKVQLSYDPASVPPQLARALERVAPDVHLARDAARPTARLQLGGDGPAFTWDGQTAGVSGATVPQVTRALMLLRSFATTGDIPADYREATPFRTAGLMVDASRNAVPALPTVKLILRRMALLGLNALMLYTEDTYEVPGQPYIGYLRGRYTQAELRELDAYAADLGIEMFPCIQTLAHLGQALRWPAFKAVRDTPDILLAEEPQTYALLEQMISAATAPYRSRRVHIGMDEAHDIGLGNYRRRHGVRPRFEILSKHLERVVGLCRERGLSPMIWSDMYFRLAAADGHYYAADAKVPPEVIPGIPRDVQMVYWDYYHTDPGVYCDFIERHRAMPNDLVLCLGLWTWNRFWMCENLTLATTDAGMIAARQAGLAEVFTAAWGDDGSEVDLLSILPGLTQFAAHAYNAAVNPAMLERQFAAACNADWQQWSLCAAIDETPARPTLREAGFEGVTPGLTDLADNDTLNWDGASPSKVLLWQDPLTGLVDGHALPFAELAAYYRALSPKLATQLSTEPFLGVCSRAHLPLAVSRVLELKADLGPQLRSAYHARDRHQLLALRDRILPQLIERCHALHETHRRIWFELYKPFGWDVLDRRYGGLLARLQSTVGRLDDLLDGRITQIEELDEPLLPAFDWAPGKFGDGPHHHRLAGASTIV